MLRMYRSKYTSRFLRTVAVALVAAFLCPVFALD